MVSPYMYSLRLLTACGLIKFKENGCTALCACVQNLGDTAGADRRWSNMLRIAITPMVWGTDFHVYVISVVLNIHVYIICT